jgi:hypothetical protein
MGQIHKVQPDLAKVQNRRGRLGLTRPAPVARSSLSSSPTRTLRDAVLPPRRLPPLSTPGCLRRRRGRALVRIVMLYNPVQLDLFIAASHARP